MTRACFNLSRSLVSLCLSVPVPLLKQPETPLRNLAPPDKRPYLTSYFGNLRHGPKRFRQTVRTEAENAARRLHAKTTGFKTQSNYREMMGQSRVSLCPRGFGRTSYLLMETLQMGLVPVYVYSDTPWVPYWDIFVSIGFVATPKTLGRILGEAQKMHPSELLKREARALSHVESHFSYQGAMDQISRFLLNPSESDLKCRGIPTSKKGF